MCESYPLRPAEFRVHPEVARRPELMALLRRINEGGPPTFARAGVIHGPGSGASDSIPIFIDSSCVTSKRQIDAEKRDAWRRSVGLLPPEVKP